MSREGWNLTNQDKKRWLARYQEINKDIDQLLLEQSQLKDLVTRVTPNLSGMPRGGGGDGRQAAIAKIVDLERQIDQKIDALADLRREIARVVEAVPNSNYRRLLNLRYIAGKRWEDVPGNLCSQSDGRRGDQPAANIRGGCELAGRPVPDHYQRYHRRGEGRPRKWRRCIFRLVAL